MVAGGISVGVPVAGVVADGVRVSSRVGVQVDVGKGGRYSVCPA